MKSNKYTPAAGSLLRTGTEQFTELHRRSGDVEKLFTNSVTLEVKMMPMMKKFIMAGLLALRAARKLIPSFPEDSELKEYLHELVDHSFTEVIKELAAEEPTKVPQAPKAPNGSGTVKK